MHQSRRRLTSSLPLPEPPGVDYNDPVVMEALVQQFKAHSEDATKRSRPLFSDDARDLKDALDLEVEADVSARMGTQGARPTALAPAPGFASALGTYVGRWATWKMGRG